MQEIVSLQELVGEFGERHSVASLTIETLLYRILCHHVVDGNKLADLASELEEGKVLHPVVVVDEFGLVWNIGFEVEEFCELVLDALLVVTQGFLVEQVAF